ncbi:MAG: DASH family cryptochrome [Gomphosphaeria aponina SAG 52.96 = DSM 107014]|uniref:Cryptochrome DASH n=1 Tax=Gomphosphaeria aponina SAG 52.96 = DSM 107014 TaxID=1521640 RepID=A0A941GXU1_9CHRO|nr:DASH family cryptochrome [Gomphosphaeria aponina SAG 52.96 = DSM 107014]
MRILIWYRHDLRLQDHEPIYNALQAKAEIIPFYCFDERQFGKTSFGFPKTGAFRAQFLLESITDLRHCLQQLGSNLVVSRGIPEVIIPKLAQQLNIDAVYFHKEVTSEELAVETALKKALAAIKVKVNSFWGTTLYHRDDLPFSLAQIPELFTNFRKKVEKDVIIRPIFPSPKTLPQLPEINLGEIPNLAELGIEKPINDERGVLKFQGGETAGKARLKHYFWEANCLKDYKQTRNGMLGANYSSKFSPWLAHGCLSPRYINDEVDKYEAERVKNDSTYWLVFELLWRDFFRFICAKHGNKIFYLSGLQGIDIPWKEDWERFSLWQKGNTGFPLVDANMREIRATGFMSNRGRQNVASFLTKNLGINWQMGAEWFESLLIDYDVCSNWGNWNYTAGVGNDARGFRYFNMTKQSKDYDPQGEYLRHWLPEIASIPGGKIHEPWQLSGAEQKNFGVSIGVDYPRPVVDFFKSVKANKKVYNASSNPSSS